MPPPEHEVLLGLCQLRLRGEPLPGPCETRIRRKRAGKRHAEMTLSTTVWQGGPAVVLVLRDISERKRLEQGLPRIEPEVKRNEAQARLAEPRVLENEHRDRTSSQGLDQAEQEAREDGRQGGGDQNACPEAGQTQRDTG